MTKTKIILCMMLILCLTSLSFAQEEKVAKELFEAAVKGSTHVTLPEQVGRVVAQHTFPTTFPRPGVQLTQIINWSTKPLVRVESPFLMSEAPLVMKILPAQAINGEAFRQVVFPQQGYRNLPVALNDSSPALYRGMPLSLKDIKNLLINGLELERSSFPQLYFSADIDIALACANEENTLLPVVVKVNVTPELEMVRRPRLYEYDNYVFNGSIPSQFINRVLLLLDVNGERGWYEATLKGDELLFKPATTRLFKKEELIKHRFDTPMGAPDMSLRSLWEDFGSDGLW